MQELALVPSYHLVVAKCPQAAGWVAAAGAGDRQPFLGAVWVGRAAEFGCPCLGSLCCVALHAYIQPRVETT